MNNTIHASIIAIVFPLIIISLGITIADMAFAEKSENAKGKQISLEDLGILQLAAHDLFNIDRVNEIDFENGKLDLSTLLVDMKTGLDFESYSIALGGEVRNRENIMIFTVASELGHIYLELIDDYGSEKAYEETIKLYHKKLKKAYQRTFTDSFPNKIEGDVTMTENLAFRTVHDFLPGIIKVNGHMIPTLDPSLHGMTLDQKELKQLSSKLDGKFDQEFLAINIFIPPSTFIVVNLLEADSNFATQFLTDFSFEYFLDEVADGKYDNNEDVMIQIRNLIAKGLNF